MSDGLGGSDDTVAFEGFSGDDLAAISNSICKRARPERIGRLGDILRDWAENDLREHFKLESPKDSSARNKRLQSLSSAITQTLRLLNNMPDLDVDVIALSMGNLDQRVIINRVVEDLNNISNGAQFGVVSRDRGQPRNYIAFLISRDAARIYEYVTGFRATRRYGEGGWDDTGGNDSGTFGDFCAAIWKAIFGNTRGLQNSLKVLEEQRKAEGGEDSSPIVANIRLRNPDWQLP